MAVATGTAMLIAAGVAAGGAAYTARKGAKEAEAARKAAAKGQQETTISTPYFNEMLSPFMPYIANEALNIYQWRRGQNPGGPAGNSDMLTQMLTEMLKGNTYSGGWQGGYTQPSLSQSQRDAAIQNIRFNGGIGGLRREGGVGGGNPGVGDRFVARPENENWLMGSGGRDFNPDDFSGGIGRMFN